jgi:site-specific recombinase XerD
MGEQLINSRKASLASETRRFDARSAQAFVYKFNSPETRKAYARAISDFFESLKWPHQSEIKREHVIAYREQLVRLNRRPRTIAQRLAALRSYFDYLVAEGSIERNPAATKLVEPPRISRVPAGRALSKKQALNLLAGLDRTWRSAFRRSALCAPLQSGLVLTGGF